MNRERRSLMAQETLAILNNGGYNTSHGSVALADDLAASCAGTRLYLPDQFEDLLARVQSLPRSANMSIVVNQRTTLAAASALAEAYPALACLNFASAKNPGGGFLSGSQAQEESLARSSGLYATLQTQPEFYAYHRQQRSALYSDRVIFSPRVPVFRDDAGVLSSRLWHTSFLTAAAPNAGAIHQNQPEQHMQIVPTLQQRARMVLAVAALQQCDALVLGAWGCGVFRNDPLEVAAVFASVLQEQTFQHRFQHITFAVFDTSPNQDTFRAFQQTFA